MAVIITTATRGGRLSTHLIMDRSKMLLFWTTTDDLVFFVCLFSEEDNEDNLDNCVPPLCGSEEKE